MSRTSVLADVAVEVYRANAAGLYVGERVKSARRNYLTTLRGHPYKQFGW